MHSLVYLKFVSNIEGPTSIRKSKKNRQCTVAKRWKRQTNVNKKNTLS